HVVERVLHVQRRGSVDHHGGVAPARTVLLQYARRPLASDPYAAGDPDRRVDDEQLAMVARNHAEPRAKAGRVEHGDLHAAAPQLLEKFLRRAAAADPVAQQSHVDAAARGPDERLAEPLAHFVRPKDVTL